MSLNFPFAPNLNDTYTLGTRTWRFNGDGWEIVPPPSPVGFTGSQGAVKVTISPTPPDEAGIGDVWIESTTGIQYFYVDDGDSFQWVEFSNPGTTGFTGSIGSGGGDSTGPAVGVFYENSTTITENYTITEGKNAMSTGPITIDDDVVVTVPPGSRWIIL
jgi:hypothetical protein